ncbi:MAG: hypothetical protein CVV61_02725 [Tenericutes bacterium HGW-Tenericutes-6]|jgi:hypothetical protein|nr:MAG: hypothetical protein CVV61_02725 [Tenericutes bacterium HGW-Tenericutes-6]PKK96258.1 MAG: hypothetical protein CVV58_07300 [Tenericutes bacterium HGW-Tenericutes-3]
MLNNFLTTEEILKRIHTSTSTVQAQKTHVPKAVKSQKDVDRKNKIKKIIYFSLLALAIIHIVFVTIPLIAPAGAVNVIGRQYVMAVPNNQELDNELNTKIVQIKPFRIDDVSVGDAVVIYGKFGTNVYWVEEIVAIDYGNQTIDASFDGFLRNTYLYEEVSGTLIRETSLFGTLLFVATQARGYLALLVTYTVIFGTVYYFYIREPKQKNINIKK